MKQTIIKYLKKAFSIHIVISRFFQFGISMIMALTVFTLANKTGQSELSQGFYSGCMLAFMLEQLNRVFLNKR